MATRSPSPRTLTIILQPLADAPRIPCARLEVCTLETISTLRVFVRRAIGLDGAASVWFVCAERTVSPDADEVLGSLLASFGPAPLVLSYSTRRVIGCL